MSRYEVTWAFENGVVDISVLERGHDDRVVRRQTLLSREGVTAPMLYFNVYFLLRQVAAAESDRLPFGLAELTMLLADLMDFMQANQGIDALVPRTANVAALPAPEDLQVP